jgi:hypothetical protein
MLVRPRCATTFRLTRRLAGIGHLLIAEGEKTSKLLRERSRAAKIWNIFGTLS